MRFSGIVADCGRIEEPANGNASATAGPMTSVSVLGDVDRPAVISFACDVGFELMGPKERRCLSNGTWSGYQPVCKCELYCMVLQSRCFLKRLIILLQWWSVVILLRLLTAISVVMRVHTEQRFSFHATKVTCLPDQIIVHVKQMAHGVGATLVVIVRIVFSQFIYCISA